MIKEIDDLQANAMIAVLGKDILVLNDSIYRMIKKAWINAGYIGQELKPCPLNCDGTVEQWKEEMFGITCNVCGFTMTHNKRLDLNEVWNKRK